MKISIGDNNKISKSVIGKNNKVTPTEDGIAKGVITGIIVTVIGGILLAFALAVLGLSNP